MRRPTGSHVECLSCDAPTHTQSDALNDMGTTIRKDENRVARANVRVAKLAVERGLDFELFETYGHLAKDN